MGEELKVHIIYETFNDGDVSISEREIPITDLFAYWGDPDNEEQDIDTAGIYDYNGEYSTLMFDLGRSGRTWIFGEDFISGIGMDREAACVAYVDAKKEQC